MFYTKNVDVDVILQEMKIANVLPSKVLKKMHTDWLFRKKSFDEAPFNELKFWAEFVAQMKVERKVPNQRTINHLDSLWKNTNDFYPESLQIESGYIFSVKYFEGSKPYVVVCLIVKIDYNEIIINAYMSIADVIEGLRRASNHSLSSVIRSEISSNINDEAQANKEILIREWHKTFLFCKDLGLKLVKCDFIVDEQLPENHNCYEVSTFSEYLSA